MLSYVSIFWKGKECHLKLNILLWILKQFVCAMFIIETSLLRLTCNDCVLNNVQNWSSYNGIEGATSSLETWARELSINYKLQVTTLQQEEEEEEEEEMTCAKWEAWPGLCVLLPEDSFHEDENRGSPLPKPLYPKLPRKSMFFTPLSTTTKLYIV